jgi:UDP-N-acetylglucosamine diphosphorylase / glucose-1-phosphate thymidylyltransferase / UDP-N-acetylgalactosamine diphosphorylase / glucosamine-1-phosphate N-acetyltransferase / galactosamine-1-phosphate N-acetyltransferase
MTQTTSAVILARGLGTRMRPGEGRKLGLSRDQQRAADAGAKAMMPIGRPFLDYVISALADGGITDVVLVIGPAHREVREYFTRTAPPKRVRVSFAEQAEAKGTADAVLAAERSVDSAPFLVLNADNLYPPEAVRDIAAVEGNGLVGFEADALVRDSNIEPDRVLRYALCDVDAGGWLREIVEKPSSDHPLARAAARLVSMNLWSFTPEFFEACRRTTPSDRGELEIQTAVAIAMRDLGLRFRVARSHAGVLDLSTRADIATVAARLKGIVPNP